MKNIAGPECIVRIVLKLYTLVHTLYTLYTLYALYTLYTLVYTLM